MPPSAMSPGELADLADEKDLPMSGLHSGGLATIVFGPDGLIPVVVQDRTTGEVLMVAFTTREMVSKTLETGQAWFWSRSRSEPWHKGATSGNYLNVTEIRRNCEENSLLYLADPIGPTCHTGAVSCYYRTLDGNEIEDPKPWLEAAGPRPGSLPWLHAIIEERKRAKSEGSYVAGLLARGVDRIAKKVGEEAAEVIIAAKNRSHEELSSEMADLWFHTLVLLADAGMSPADVETVLASRHK